MGRRGRYITAFSEECPDFFSAASATGVTPKLHSLVTGGSGSDEEFVYCALLVVRQKS